MNSKIVIFCFCFHFCDAIFNFSCEGQSDISNASFELLHYMYYMSVSDAVNFSWTDEVFDVYTYQTYPVIYRIHQNSSPRIVAFQSNGLRPNTGQTNPVDLRDMLTSARPRSLSHFPSFYFLPCSDQRGCNPPQQLSVQTDSVKHFPSIFPLSHSHAYTNHFPSLLHINAFFPHHTFIKPVRVLLKDENVFVRGCFLPLAGTCLLLTIKK